MYSHHQYGSLIGKECPLILCAHVVTNFQSSTVRYHLRRLYTHSSLGVAFAMWFLKSMHCSVVLVCHRALPAGLDVWWCHGDHPLFSRGTHLPISHALLLRPRGELPQHRGKVSHHCMWSPDLNGARKTDLDYGITRGLLSRLLEVTRLSLFITEPRTVLTVKTQRKVPRFQEGF